MRISHFSTKKQDFIRNSEKGSVIVWILVAIALFAALNYAVSKGTRSGATTITKEKAAVAASEIIDYGRALKQAVQTLQINGCSDTDVSFQNAVVAGYSHIADTSCHVFHPNGGGMNYLVPHDEWVDGVNTAQTHYQTWYTTSNSWVLGLGTDGSGSNCSGGAGDSSCRELITGVPFIREEICIEINKKLGVGADSTGTPYQDTGNSYSSPVSTFVGTYSTSGNQMGNATPSNYSNIMAGCIEGDSTPGYSFFQVLIVR